MIPDIPNSWHFDKVVDMLENGILVEGVKRFDMRIVSDDESACLFGSTAIYEGFKNTGMIMALFLAWKPNSIKMAKIHHLCQEVNMTRDDVIAQFREIQHKE